jgi:hypothetical protein
MIVSMSVPTSVIEWANQEQPTCRKTKVWMTINDTTKMVTMLRQEKVIY